MGWSYTPPPLCARTGTSWVYLYLYKLEISSWNFSIVSCYFFPLVSKHSPQHAVLISINLRHFLWMREQHPLTAVKINPRPGGEKQTLCWQGRHGIYSYHCVHTFRTPIPDRILNDPFKEYSLIVRVYSSVPRFNDNLYFGLGCSPVVKWTAIEHWHGAVSTNVDFFSLLILKQKLRINNYFNYMVYWSVNILTIITEIKPSGNATSYFQVTE